MASETGLSTIIGQDRVIERVRGFCDFYASNGQVPEHILLSGPDGMGKRTIALGIAGELGVVAKFSSARDLGRKGDLTAILTALEPREVLVLEDIQRLKPPIREVLIPALETFKIDLVIGQGPRARIHPFPLSHFTCISIVLRENDLPSELRGAFPLVCTLQPYARQDLAKITGRIAASIGITMSPEVTEMVANPCDGSPHHVEILVRQLARTGKKELTQKDVGQTFAAFGLNPQTTKSTVATGTQILSGMEFEHTIAALLRRMGFRTEVTKASGDGGIDIIAIWEKPILGGRYLIQCKRFAEDAVIGASVVREFYGALIADRKAAKGIFITTASFSGQAKQFALGLPIELVDGEKLRQLLLEFGEKPPKDT